MKVKMNFSYEFDLLTWYKNYLIDYLTGTDEKENSKRNWMGYKKVNTLIHEPDTNYKTKTCNYYQLDGDEEKKDY